jgi:hypothetical protein
MVHDTEPALTREPLAALVSKLATLSGTFEKGPLRSWEFDDGTDIFDAISSHGDSAVAVLVDCLDDTARAVATADHGLPVRVGYMCYEALRRTAYYEWDPQDYERARYRRWPGVLEPSAGPKDLRAAKAAWKLVVSRRAYSLS